MELIVAVYDDWGIGKGGTQPGDYPGSDGNRW